MPTLSISMFRAPTRPRLSLLVGTLLALLAWSGAAAQDQAPLPPQSPLATRAELEQVAATLEQRAASAKSSDERTRLQNLLTMVRARLRDGDFEQGDRLVVHYDTAGGTATDTFTVQMGRVVKPRELPELSLQGVLRSEVQDYLEKQYGRYIRNPNVQVVPRVRVAIYGPVANPGFYDLPYTALLSDAIMAAGGPGQAADMNKTYIQRGKRKVFEERDVQLALMRGATLDQVNLRPGDAIVVGSAGKKDWVEILRGVGIAVGLGLTLFTLGRKL
ncbi:MAG TPA: SLBB domain-containing protein [Gemmatimonadaceae bacterium]|nr:SLBB domain-containing protein [Gemmatimonadaceae bacterium]